MFNAHGLSPRIVLVKGLDPDFLDLDHTSTRQLLYCNYVDPRLIGSKWYSEAKVCYVYLADIYFPDHESRLGAFPTESNVPGWFSVALHHQQNGLVGEMQSQFLGSRWWTRGWTLQELLAPTDVVFFTQDWTTLGHKSGLASWISVATKIHSEALEDPATIRSFSVAQRMSWAAERQTTVVEDMAYCLLGIFDINMPMLYGQGESAFQKLQHEIIKASDDQSIFAWAAETNDSPWTGALARSPREFKFCGSILQDQQSFPEPHALTNVGFKMRVPMIRTAFATQFFIGLGCGLELHEESPGNDRSSTSRRWIRVWIPVRKRGNGNSYERIHAPTSHVYFQTTYQSYNIQESTDIFLLKSPSCTHVANQASVASPNEANRTGIAVTIGFGNMSIVSKAYREAWHPRDFLIIPVGSQEPCCSSHEVIASGNYCIVLSVAWDEYCNPQKHEFSAFHFADARTLADTLDQLMNTDRSQQHLVDVDSIHQQLRSVYHDTSIARKSAEAPMVVVEDVPLYDMHHLASVMVDVIFKEKGIPDTDRRRRF